jgi:uncharacterized protein (TIGR03032 family)
MKEQQQQISFTYSQNIVAVLKQLKCTIVMSTYQSGKLMIIGQYDDAIDIRYKDFPRPMGMYASNNKLWAGLGHGIWQFNNFSNAGKNLDNREFNACYLPMNIYFTGDIDIHEMQYCNDELYFINTKFSCLCIADKNSSFKPIWKPPFISVLQPTDKCHLNGFCTRDNEPRYITALGVTDEPLGWRKNKANGGILMDITTNEILLTGLSMPHSPRWYQEKLWLLESGKGSLSYYDFEKKKAIEVVSVPGFTRGISFVGDLAFIGVSKVRESATFSGLPITKLQKRVSGIWIVDIKKAKIISFIEFTQGIDEVFAVSILPHSDMEIFGFDNLLSQSNYIVLDNNIAEVKMPETPLEIASPLFEKGTDLFNENKKEEAIVQYKKALEVQPDFLPATFNMAIALGDLGRFDEAEKILLDVIENDASIVETYNSLGYVYYRKGDFEKAKENFEKAIELKPDFQQAKASLEILLKEMKINDS